MDSLAARTDALDLLLFDVCDNLQLSPTQHGNRTVHDLPTFRQEAHRQIQAMHDAVIAKPSNLTDIFGTLDVAQQELESGAEGGPAKRK